MSFKYNDNQKPSKQLNLDDAVEVWLLLFDGCLQSRIAAKFDVNSGRISEIKTRKKFPEAYNIAAAKQNAA